MYWTDSRCILVLLLTTYLQKVLAIRYSSFLPILFSAVVKALSKSTFRCYVFFERYTALVFFSNQQSICACNSSRFEKRYLLYLNIFLGNHLFLLPPLGNASRNRYFLYIFLSSRTDFLTK